MGRNELLSDSQTLIDAETAYAKNGGSFKSVIISLLTSDSFIYRKETQSSNEKPKKVSETIHVGRWLDGNDSRPICGQP